MRRVLAATVAVMLLLFGGPVLHDLPGGVTWAAWSGPVLVVLAFAFTWRRPNRDGYAAAAAGAVTGAYLLWSAMRGPSSTFVIGWAVAMILVAGWWVWVTRRGSRGPRAPRPVKAAGWWDEAALLAAFTTAGVLREPREGDPPSSLPGLRPPERDDYGTTVKLTLPPGVLFSTLSARREALAAAMTLPLHLLTITQARSDPANLATIRVTLPYERTVRVHDLPAVTSWREPLVVGRDRRQRDVSIPTWNTGQVLVGGRTGSGKTYFLRLLAAHYALDPAAAIYVVDGKGSTDDWGPLRARCTHLLFIHDDRPGDRFMDLLTEVQEVVTDRNRTGGRAHPGALVILEEFSSFLGSLDAGPKRDAERAVARLAQTCRSANVMVVIAAQRPSASSMDTNTRAQAAVSVALAMKSPTDTTMVLGHTPTLELPDEPGEAIVVVPGSEDVLLDLDTLPDGEWETMCAGLPLRAPAPRVWPDDEDDDEPAVQVGPSERVPVVADRDAAVAAGTSREAVLVALTELGGRGRTGQVIAVTGYARRTVALALTALVAAGEVEKLDRGEYALIGYATAQSVLP